MNSHLRTALANRATSRPKAAKKTSASAPPAAKKADESAEQSDTTIEPSKES